MSRKSFVPPFLTGTGGTSEMTTSGGPGSGIIAQGFLPTEVVVEMPDGSAIVADEYGNVVEQYVDVAEEIVESIEEVVEDVSVAEEIPDMLE